MVANPSFVSPFMAEIFIRYISTLDAKYAFKLTVEKSSNTQIGPEGLEKIRIPTLIIWGSEDKVIPAEHAKVFHRQIIMLPIRREVLKKPKIFLLKKNIAWRILY